MDLHLPQTDSHGSTREVKINLKFQNNSGHFPVVKFDFDNLASEWISRKKTPSNSEDTSAAVARHHNSSTSSTGSCAAGDTAAPVHVVADSGNDSVMCGVLQALGLSNDQ